MIPPALLQELSETTGLPASLLDIATELVAMAVVHKAEPEDYLRTLLDGLQREAQEAARKKFG